MHAVGSDCDMRLWIDGANAQVDWLPYKAENVIWKNCCVRAQLTTIYILSYTIINHTPFNAGAAENGLLDGGEA